MSKRAVSARRFHLEVDGLTCLKSYFIKQNEIQLHAYRIPDFVNSDKHNAEENMFWKKKKKENVVSSN